MKTRIDLPEKEVRYKRLFIPITESEQKKIRKICKEKKITIADLVRYALNQIMEF
jgi:16S rRNA U516 pseudouridylate synthase RsuA-like enzyme